MARTWASTTVIHLLELVHKMWITRNGILHERAENGEKRELALQLEARIREEFDQGYEDLHPCDHHYFEDSVDAVLEMDGAQQQAWLDGVEGARVSYVENRDVELEAMRHLLRDWLNSGD